MITVKSEPKYLQNQLLHYVFVLALILPFTRARSLKGVVLGVSMCFGMFFIILGP